jgi:UDP-glucose 4-epimerase
MKILITGGLGHIGSYILENINKLKSVKHLYIIDDLSTNRYCSFFNLPKTNKKIYFIQKDLSAKNALKKFKKVDVVINLASLTDAAGSIKVKNKIWKNNIGIFENVIQYCSSNSAKLIHISTTSVYGEQKGLVDENCIKMKPKSPYAIIKLKEESLLKENKYKINYVTYRFGTISGVSKGMRFHTAVNKFSFNAVLGLHLPVWKSMMNKPRPYLSLKDAFKVIKFTLEKNFFSNEIFNIISEHLTVKQIINLLRKYGKKIKINHVHSQLINQFSYKISNDKFSKKAFTLKSLIKDDIKSTLKIFKGINS